MALRVLQNESQDSSFTSSGWVLGGLGVDPGIVPNGFGNWAHHSAFLPYL